jgi:hypothetical protein
VTKQRLSGHKVAGSNSACFATRPCLTSRGQHLRRRRLSVTKRATVTINDIGKVVRTLNVIALRRVARRKYKSCLKNASYF